MAAIERAAESAMQRGIGQAQAYDRAISDGLRSAHGVKRLVDTVDRLLSASDDATMARYDYALNAFITAGDEAPLEALAPMMRSDMQAMAVRAGEVSVEDAAAGRVDWAALGVPGFVEGGGDVPATAPETPVQREAALERFAFAGAHASPQAAGAWTNQDGARTSAGFGEDRRRAAHDATVRPGQAPRTGPAPAHVERDAWSNQAGASTRGQFAEDRRQDAAGG